MTPVIIPSFGKPEQLARCLDALKDEQASAFVHDNNEKNIGWTAAVNHWLRFAGDNGHPYAITLNQDCYVEPGSIEKCVAFMDAHPRCAIAGWKQIHDGNSDAIIHAGGLQAYPFGQHACGKVSCGDFTVSRQRAWVNGAAMCFRLEALREFGMLDEGMFLVGSDSDICFTARLRGWEVWYCADAQCRHEVGESHRPSTKELQDIMRRDMTYWRDKWVGSAAFARLSRHE